MKSKKVKLCAVLFGFLLVIVCGCENDSKIQKEQLDTLMLEKKQLTYQIEKAESENKQLKEQVEVLSGLSSEARFENLYHLQRVKVTRYTNLYDKDEDGQYESLIVYVQPMDEQGDIVKATGAVDVQLWDLEKKGGRAMLGQWRVEPGELKKLWFATLVTINYRLTFDVSEIIDKYEKPLVVKVTFTDYLTGKVFEEQKTIKP